MDLCINTTIQRSMLQYTIVHQPNNDRPIYKVCMSFMVFCVIIKSSFTSIIIVRIKVRFCNHHSGEVSQSAELYVLLDT